MLLLSLLVRIISYLVLRVLLSLDHECGEVIRRHSTRLAPRVLVFLQRVALARFYLLIISRAVALDRSSGVRSYS